VKICNQFNNIDIRIRCRVFVKLAIKFRIKIWPEQFSRKIYFICVAHIKKKSTAHDLFRGIRKGSPGFNSK
jgi:hypothetical protein